MVVSATDKSVRNHSQKATIKDGVITVTCMTFRVKAGSFFITLDEWERTKTGPTLNARYNKFELVSSKYLDKYQEDYNQSPAQGNRIIDAQILAIEKAFQKLL